MENKKFLNISGQSFEVTQKMYDTMPYFAESEAISQSNTHTIDIFSA